MKTPITKIYAEFYCGLVSLRKVQFVKETSHCLYDSNHRRVYKISDAGRYFDSFEAAKNWLLEMLKFKRSSLAVDMGILTSKIGTLISVKEEELK